MGMMFMNNDTLNKEQRVKFTVYFSGMIVQSYVNITILYIALPKLQCFATIGSIVVFMLAILHRIIGFKNLKEYTELVIIVFLGIAAVTSFHAYTMKKLHLLE
jgi:hypothetical protein